MATGRYYSDDITWCSKRECTVTECERNQKNIRKNAPFYKYFSVANLEKTNFCKKEKK